MELYRRLGRAVADRRRELGLTQSTVAEKLGLSRASLANLESGRQRIMVHQLFALVNALKLEVRPGPRARCLGTTGTSAKYQGQRFDLEPAAAVSGRNPTRVRIRRRPPEEAFAMSRRGREKQSPAGGAGLARPACRSMPYLFPSSVLQSRSASAWSTLRWTMSSPGSHASGTTCRSSASTRCTRPIGKDLLSRMNWPTFELHRHELEHAVHVDRGSLRRDALAAEGVDPIEIEANSFAAELLMPTLSIDIGA